MQMQRGRLCGRSGCRSTAVRATRSRSGRHRPQSSGAAVIRCAIADGRPSTEATGEDAQRNRFALTKTKVVATIGPSTADCETFEQLADTGLNVARLNFSHGTHEWHKSVLDMVRSYNERNPSRRTIGTLLDTKGPEVRSGDLRTPVELLPGERYTFTGEGSPDGSDNVIGLNYPGFVNDVECGDVLLVDGGEMSLSVCEKDDTAIVCECIDGGILKSRRHLNVRGKSASLPSITEKDWEDIEFGIRENVDFFALSFVRDGDAVRELKRELNKRGCRALVLSKIETADSVRNLEDILEASDGAMVARGDLGAELPVEDVPLIQNKVISVCWQLGRPVIVATNMLESMISNPTPTRAEVSDIAVAVREGADAVMLSGETANGKYPLKAMQVMTQTCGRVEDAMIHHRLGADGGSPYDLSATNLDVVAQTDIFSMGVARMVTGHRSGSFLLSGGMGGTGPTSISSLLAYNAVCMTNSIGATVVVFTRTGYMATVLSHYRPDGQIFAFTDSSETLGRLSLYHNVTAMRIDFKSTFDETFKDAIKTLQLSAGERVVLVQSGHQPIWRESNSHVLQIYTVPGDEC